MRRVDPVEKHVGLNLATIRDIGLFKLMSASSRASDKDIYDLDYLTDQINLIELIDLLETKLVRDLDSRYRTIFDLDGLVNPVKNPHLLLEFDRPNMGSEDRPNHSNRRIQIQESAKEWQEARISWRSKLRSLFRSKDIEFPKA